MCYFELFFNRAVGSVELNVIDCVVLILRNGIGRIYRLNDN